MNLGKFGTFNTNQIIGRPYRLTYEFLEQEDPKARPELRVVPAAELHAEALGSDHAAPAETREGADDDAPADKEGAFDIVGDNGDVIMRNNRLTVDDPSRQTLTMEEIEELKKAGSGSGKDIIEKIMASHLGIEEKTQFSLAKYTLRKSRKYLKRFTVLPLDIPLLNEYMTEKEAYRIMELRDDSLGLMCSWANIHSGSTNRVLTAEDGTSQIGGGRWLVVDDTGGLVTASLAERVGILYPEQEEESSDEEGEDEEQPDPAHAAAPATTAAATQPISEDTAMPDAPAAATPSTANTAGDTAANTPADASNTTSTEQSRPPRKPRQHIPQSCASTNTLTIVHPNNQPNLSHLKYFGFDSGDPKPDHPLYTHLKSLSWLQLLHPNDDPTYIEPEVLTPQVLETLKSSKRGNYYRKRRRWERTKRVVDETRAGGFDGLVVASTMEPVTIMKACVPLVKGGGQVVVYSHNAEPLVQLCDYYSKERRTAYIARQFGSQTNGKRKNGAMADDEDRDEEDEEEEDNFPVNPTLLLAPSLQTARAREWQVLPQRTHPLMTSKGGAEGYLFTATRVLPVEGKVEARGHRGGKKRKTGEASAVAVSA